MRRKSITCGIRDSLGSVRIRMRAALRRSTRLAEMREELGSDTLALAPETHLCFRLKGPKAVPVAGDALRTFATCSSRQPSGSHDDSKKSEQKSQLPKWCLLPDCLKHNQTQDSNHQKCNT